MAPSPAQGEMEKKAPELEENEENGEEEEEEMEEMEEEESERPFHLPFAPPSSELMDDSTTVDPSYVISLIRQLLPLHLDREKEASLTGETLEKEDPWEDFGCILWDLAAAETQAKVMVDNFIIDVLLANLHASKSPRIKEICLGIIGNLACHESLSSKLSSREGLIETVVQQLFLDDSSCLTEVFRLLGAAIQTSARASWSEALLSEEVLHRVLWILENTLNLSLFEKCIDFLLVVIDNAEVAKILLEPLMKLGLADIAVSLVTIEVEKPGDGNTLERTEVLDKAISLVEGLSAVDGFLEAVSSKEKLVKSLCKILKVPDKFELSESCTSAVLILANLLADENLVTVLASEFAFLEGLFDSLPVVSDDVEATNALWCVISRFLGEAVNKFSDESIYRLAESILDKTVIIEEGIHAQFFEESQEESVGNDYVRLHGVRASITRIVQIIEKWLGERSLLRKNGAVERAHSVATEALQKLEDKLKDLQKDSFKLLARRQEIKRELLCSLGAGTSEK